jgi:hypothetical protein
MRRRIGARPALTGVAIGLAVCLTAPPIVIASSQTETYQLHLEVPNIAQAPNGDRVAVTGSGMFSIHPKTVTATGTFTHTDSAGNRVGTGSWTAVELLTFEPDGCGVLTFPDPARCATVVRRWAVHRTTLIAVRSVARRDLASNSRRSPRNASRPPAISPEIIVFS